MRLMIIGASGFLGGHVRRQALRGRDGGDHGWPFRLADSPDHQLVDLGRDDPAQIAAMIAGWLRMPW